MSNVAQSTSVPAIFSFENHSVRTFADEQGEPLFVGKDVCDVLGYANDSLTIKKHCKLYGVSKRYLTDSMGREQEVTVINEGNLYRLIIRSRKPEAERFERKVMDEILPAIRKTGEYRTPYVTGPNDTLTAAQAEQLRLLIKSLCERLPKDFQAGFNIKVWSKLKSHFGVSYRQIPQSEYSEALSLVARHATEYPCIAEPQKSPAGALPPIDVRGLLLSGQSTPTLPLPGEIQDELERKAWEMARETYDLSRGYLSRKIAYRCEYGSPRQLNVERARQLINEGGLGHALAHTYYGEVDRCLHWLKAGRDAASDAIKEIEKQVSAHLGGQKVMRLS